MTSAPDLEVEFLLVPGRLAKGQEPTPFLAEGEVALYPPGAYEPRHVLPANRVVKVPNGTWFWVASAPGYVSAEAGAITVPAGATRSVAPRRIIAPMVPACEVQLGQVRDWPGVERVDLVSLDLGASYPGRPGRLVRVPAGRWLAYAVTAKGLRGITKPRFCAPGQQVFLRTIVAPPADREEWMVHVTFDATLDREKFRAQLLPADRGGEGPLTPVASAWTAKRATFFFLDVPVGSSRWLELGHPSLRTRGERHEVLGGRARDLGQLKLARRRSVVLTVDYQPKRPHPTQKLVLWRCGRDRAGEIESTLGSCEGSRNERWEVPLRAGISTYPFVNLDDGQYRFDAEIDEEVIWGLGRRLAPFLSPEDDTEPAPLSVRLSESEITGRLLVNGQPVPGELRVLPLDPKLGSPRTFRAGDDGEFRLFYFGFEVVAHWFSKEIVPRIPRGVTHLDHNWRVSACGEGRGCRTFGVHSRWVGEGRWDIELGEGGVVEFLVRDEETQAPVGGALVLAARSPALYFIEGKVFELSSKTQEPDTLFADSQGRVTVNAGSRTEVHYAVTHTGGYGVQRGVVPVIPGEPVQVEVLLPREEGQDDGTQLLLRGKGAPLGRAYLLVINEQGKRDLACSRASSPVGRVVFPGRCVAGKKAVLIHPSAALQILEGDQLLTSDEIFVAAAPDPPHRVKVQREDGSPFFDVPVGLRFPEMALGIGDLYLAGTATASAPGFQRTDARGEITLYGVAPEVWGPVELTVVDGGLSGSLELGDAPPGELVVLTVSQ